VKLLDTRNGAITEIRAKEPVTTDDVVDAMGMLGAT
jgi:hypothetical protein